MGTVSGKADAKKGENRREEDEEEEGIDGWDMGHKKLDGKRKENNGVKMERERLVEDRKWEGDVIREDERGRADKEGRGERGKRWIKEMRC